MLVRNKTRGFTIVEAMIVIVIVAILAAVGLPSFRESIAGSRLKAAATDIHLSLVRARSEAIKRNANVTVSAAEGWKAGWTVSDGIETHGAVAGDSITIEGDTSIVYTPNGRTTVNPIEINLTSAETSMARCIRISLSGHPAVKKEAC